MSREIIYFILFQYICYYSKKWCNKYEISDCCVFKRKGFV